jgi:probable selenium-dependent hydroxylase accessory protein YqeC
MLPIEKMLFPEPQGVLSLTGGGGKTSLMFHLARLLVQAGKTVLTTTTTKIFVPTAEQSTTVLVATDPETILHQAESALRATRQITAAAERMADTGKLKGFAPEAITTFAKSGLFDWIIVEADGAARRPLKAPASHEPVIPPATTILVALAGLEVIGSPLTEELVFRSELAGQRMNLAAGETITETALARLLAHPLGFFKDAPPQARRFIFLNKADTPQRREAGAEIAAVLRQMAPSLAEALIVGQLLEGVRIHAEHRLGIRP